MPLWNEILTVPVPQRTSRIQRHIEQLVCSSFRHNIVTPAPLATFELVIPPDLPHGFGDGWLADSLPAARADSPDAACRPAVCEAAPPPRLPRLRVAYSLDRRHVEAIQRGLWPSDGRRLGASVA